MYVINEHDILFTDMQLKDLCLGYISQIFRIDGKCDVSNIGEFKETG